jgi:5-methylcytosine-specific restriction endonuclease McrA
MVLMAKRRPWFQPGWVFRRARRKRIAALRARDGDNCWRCNRPMRFGAPFNRGKAATVEHVLARALGGTDDLGNLRLCHIGCNRHLGTAPPEQKERMRINRDAPSPLLIAPSRGVRGRAP